MDVLAFASRKGGSGKSTLAAHLAVHVHRPSRRCLLIDDDPQGSLTLWNELREQDALPLYDADCGSTAEIGRLWQAIEKSVTAINGARDGAAMHRVAA
jgi:cellulose biosynthesis protein BcsQ